MERSIKIIARDRLRVGLHSEPKNKKLLNVDKQFPYNFQSSNLAAMIIADGRPGPGPAHNKAQLEHTVTVGLHSEPNQR